MQALSDFLPFWPQLTAAQQQRLLDNTAEVHYKKGEIVYGAGGDCLGLLMLCTGRLCTYLLSEEGREVALFALQAGEICLLSASCALSQITFDVFIEAEADTTALLTSPAAFSAVKEENIYVENFVYKQMAEHFSDVMWVMQQILFLGFDKRLAIFLLDTAAQTGSADLRMTHEQIAKYTGSAREVVTRMLQRFAAEGLVSLSRGVIHITDSARLRKMVG